MSSSKKLRKRLKLLSWSRSQRSWTSRMSLDQSVRCSATCRTRAIFRGFRSTPGTNSLQQNSQNARFQVDKMSMATTRKKRTMDFTTTAAENNYKTQCRCVHVCHVSLYLAWVHACSLAWVHTGNTFQSQIARLSDRGQRFDCAFLDFQKAFD